MFNKDLILEILNKKGWSKYKLAKDAGIPQSSLHDILSGKIKNPTGERLKSIADALGVSVNDFFDDEPNKDIPEKEENKIDAEKQRQIHTVAAHLEDKNLTPKKLKLLNDYIDALFDDEEW